MIDQARMDELRDEIGDAVEEVFEIFLAEADGVLHQLRDAPDGPARVELLHFLRSGALNLGFRGLAERAHAAECGDVEDWPGLLAELEVLLRGVRAELNAA